MKTGPNGDEIMLIDVRDPRQRRGQYAMWMPGAAGLALIRLHHG